MWCFWWQFVFGNYIKWWRVESERVKEAATECERRGNTKTVAKRPSGLNEENRGKSQSSSNSTKKNRCAQPHSVHTVNNVWMIMCFGKCVLPLPQSTINCACVRQNMQRPMHLKRDGKWATKQNIHQLVEFSCLFFCRKKNLSRCLHFRHNNVAASNAKRECIN